MKIHYLHPKFLSDATLNQEHDFLHRLYDALSEEESSMEHPDYFRFNGRRGRIFVRHRRLIEEMNIRGLPHSTLIDRRAIESDEWEAPDVTEDEVREQAAWLRENSEPGRVPIPEGADADALRAERDLTSVMVGLVEIDDLRAYWRVFRYEVMERSYARYRALTETVQGKGRGQTWMLFDLLMEENLAAEPDERAPAIAYESLWEVLEPAANEEEKEAYAMLAKGLAPGRVSLEMREFLARAASRQGHKDLLLTSLVAPYLE